jgi:hypothetical protein
MNIAFAQSIDMARAVQDADIPSEQSLLAHRNVNYFVQSSLIKEQKTLEEKRS